MGLFERFEKKEKLHVDPDTGKSEWIVKQRGIPSIRKEKNVFDEKVKDFQKAEREKKKAAFKAKIEHYGKKWSGVQKWVGKNINPDLLNMGAGSSSSGKKHNHKKKHRRSDDDWFDPFGGNLL